MTDTFIDKIQINLVRNIRNFEIPLSNTDRRHLILTGKNGSGKTSLLHEIRLFLLKLENKEYFNLENVTQAMKHNETACETLLKVENKTDVEKRNLQHYRQQIFELQNWLNAFGGTFVSMTNKYILQEKIQNGEFIIAFFDAKRHTILKTPTGINKVNLKNTHSIDDHANQDFIQYIVNLKADRSFARDEGDIEVASKIEHWFQQFEERLKDIFQSPSLTLDFDRTNYNFQILEDNKLPYTFNTLPDGYSAILSIVTELLLRMEPHGSKNYDLEGIVLIDEIETHLHLELQKRVLPFLTQFFPRIQFITTTHSPFVISSIQNAIVCDLEKRIITTDLSGYSYDAIIESYFNSDKYSGVTKEKLIRLEALSLKTSLTVEESAELKDLNTFLDDSTKFLSLELATKLQEIKLKTLNKRN